MPVHPRVCGERDATFKDTDGTDGSSPRVRGTFLREPVLHARVRFIPACAGNVCGQFLLCHKSPVHPRVCGERTATPMRNDGRGGSSPRVRGTSVCPRCGMPLQRFIPACAGNVSMWQMSTMSLPVHPRVCGERPVRDTTPTLSDGSSPRVRGTLAGKIRWKTQRRFIPACAGNVTASLIRTSR